MNRLRWPRLLFLVALLFTGCGQPGERLDPAETPTRAEAPTLTAAETPAHLPVDALAPADAVEQEDGGMKSTIRLVKTQVYMKEDGDLALEDLPTKTPDTRPLPKYWAEWPLVPAVSEHAREIYRLGLEMGNDAHSFSTIGDCQSEPPVFMGVYDSGSYQLDEEYAYLEETIQNFQGSFQRDSITVKDGMSVASALSPMWADPGQCLANEMPLECELRLHRPSIMFVNLGTNWNGGNDATHEKYMRQVVEILIAHGVVPVLSTKGDNEDGKQRINQSIARVAYDYDIPLWNFWLSLRDLPGKGIDGSREGGYLSPEAWGRRSFTGLLALDAVWRELK